MKPKGTKYRTAFDKRVRAKAHEDGTHFKFVLDKTPGNKLFHPSRVEYRFRKRQDSMQWNAKYFICGTEIDDGELFIREEDIYDFEIDFMDTIDTPCHHTDTTISLSDIARPAKHRGQKSRDVVVSEDRFRMRQDSMQCNFKDLICGTEIDDGELFTNEEEDIYDFEIDFMDTIDTTISLSDIARPAKQSEHESQNVVVLEDDFEALDYRGDDDDWEQIYNEHHEELRTYSSVLRGNET